MKFPKELHHWIRLLHVSGIGSQRYLKLLQSFDSPEKVFDANKSQLKNAGMSDALADAILDQAEDVTNPDLEWLSASDKHFILTLEDEEYPDLLKQIDAPPPLLFVHGDITLLKEPQLAIVGSRNPTQGGRDNAYEFARHLGKHGITITSGLALGIDGFSHKGALDAKAPTIAVTATGLDRVYPAKHRDLAHAVSEQGAIVSEHTIGTPVRAQNFPRRNRIISGLSVGTLVIEAAIKSGSLITAKYAMEQGREVFAIPGSIHNPLARGCHQLIRQGAKLVENSEHILEEISPALQEYLKPSITPNTPQASKSPNQQDELDPDQRAVLQAIGFDPLPIDTIVVQTGLTIDTVSSILLMLELHNHIEACGGGRYSRLKPSVTP